MINCKNCHTELQNEDDYCKNCGGKVIRNRLTLKNLFEHISETFFNYDNKLLRTFTQLFKSPEGVIVGYINGIRKKYVNVISYFALAITLSGLQIYIMQKFQTDLTFYDTTTEIGKSQQEVFEKTFKFTSDYQSLVMMLYIPIYALIAKVVFLGIKKFNYTELIVIFLYSQAQISICIAALTLIVLPLKIISIQGLGFISMPLMFLYFSYCLKKVYNLNFSKMLLRILIFLGIMCILFVILAVISAFYMYSTGTFDEIIEAKKAIKDTIH